MVLLGHHKVGTERNLFSPEFEGLTTSAGWSVFMNITVDLLRVVARDKWPIAVAIPRRSSQTVPRIVVIILPSQEGVVSVRWLRQRGLLRICVFPKNVEVQVIEVPSLELTDHLLFQAVPCVIFNFKHVKVKVIEPSLDTVAVPGTRIASMSSCKRSKVRASQRSIANRIRSLTFSGLAIS